MKYRIRKLDVPGLTKPWTVVKGNKGQVVATFATFEQLLQAAQES